MRYQLHDPSVRTPGSAERHVHDLETRATSLEFWFGRYGALALASLTILLGVGAFLSWAIVSDQLGPWTRVALGALGAASLAVVGRHVRTHTSERFGNVLLALALAVFQVDIWGAGARLDLLSDRASLTLAALASASLAALAVHHRDAMLFNVGFGSALLAPFVTADLVGADASWLLLGYGLIVLTAGLVATRTMARTEPSWLFVLGSWMYLGWTAESTYGADLRFALAPGVFALCYAWLALVLLTPMVSARTALAVLVVAVAFIAGRVFGSVNNTAYGVLAAAIAASAIGAVWRDRDTRRTLFVGVILIPSATLWLALAIFDGEGTAFRSSVALAWAAMTLAITWPLPTRAQEAGLAAAFLCAGAVLPILFDDHTLGRTVALSAYAVCAALTMAWRRQPAAAFGIIVWLVVATVIGLRDLAEHDAYAYVPFFTRESAGALAFSAAWCATFVIVRRLLKHGADRAFSADDVVGMGAAVAVFLWGRQELSAAFSPDAAVLCLIVYYALIGVSLIYVGQLRQSLHLRPAGLALSIVAALKAIIEAVQLDAGFRIAGFLLSGLFLLAVSYWYQKSTAD